MIRLAANISLLFAEQPFEARFAAARAAGFSAVECQFPYAMPAEEVADRLSRHGLAAVLFNAPPGDWEAGERGLAAVPGRQAAFRESLELALAYAGRCGVERLHIMAGIAQASDRRAFDTFAENLRYAAPRCAARGITALIEPLNPRDVPGYFLNDFRLAERVLAEVGEPGLKLQFDVYHRQLLHGNLGTGLREWLPRIGHVQIAGVPDRGEPDRGEVDYAWLLQELDSLGYDGWVGCEYRPRGDTLAGLKWAAHYGIIGVPSANAKEGEP